MYYEGTMLQSQIAEQFGTTRSNVRKIVRRDTWEWVEPVPAEEERGIEPNYDTEAAP